jgi:NAD(P)-dependent dehydrogenase (short-subunit alcohol dehydrogenase family)
VQRGTDRLTGRMAVVVGASSGIGADTARELASRGTNVVIATRNRDGLEKVTASARDLGTGAVEPFVADVTNPDDLKSLVGFAVEGFGRLDYAVNNTGMSGREPIEELTKDFVERVLAVNLGGVFWALQAELPEIEKNGGQRADRDRPRGAHHRSSAEHRPRDHRGQVEQGRRGADGSGQTAGSGGCPAGWLAPPGGGGQHWRAVVAMRCRSAVVGHRGLGRTCPG